MSMIKIVIIFIFIFRIIIAVPLVSSIVPSLRGTVYRYGMQTTGNEWEWNRLWVEYVNTTTPQEKNRLLLGLAQAREAWLLNRWIDNECVQTTTT